MPSSFMSEHSAEFILVHDLIKILQSEFHTITPIYYWGSREGGINSRSCFTGKSIQVLAFYPRRPKVDYPGCGTVQVKVNQLLSHRKEYFESTGISIIAGVPVADKLEDIHLGTHCLWFDISPDEIDRFFTIDLATGSLSGDVPRTLDKETILGIINRYSRPMPWSSVISIIKEMGTRRENQYTPWNRYSGDLYKPIYLVLAKD